MSSYVPTVTGKYKVVVTKSTVCSRISNTVQVYKITCRNENQFGNENVLTAFLNPTSNEFTVELNSNEKFKLQVFDLQRKILLEMPSTSGQVIFGNDLRSGICLLEVNDENGNRTVQKLVKAE